jgi:valyl-tRNA synthetase
LSGDAEFNDMTDALDLPTVYDPRSVEPEIRALWDKGNYFHADPADPREPYVIVIPPPNVTGALHGGHALNNTLQDILIRWRRMQGYNTLWMPGVDHAGIATQAVVEKRIFETEKKSRHDLGREELVRRIWEWKEQYGNRIIEQLKLMGCSCDWERTRFTLDEMCARAVRETFFKLFKDGLIVRGKRLVNWDTHLQTAVADDEVYHETVKGHFYHFKYPVIDPKSGEPEFVHIATTRPETMLGDTAVAVHPDPDAALNKVEAALSGSLPLATDKERAGIEALLKEIAQRRRDVLPQLRSLRDMARDGRQVRLPLVCRPIPLICDEWARPELGSGCVKITPAHDPNDYEVGQRHKLPMINVMTPDGRIADLSSHTQKTEVSSKLEGLKFATDGRKAVVAALEERGLVEKIEDRQIELGHSDRSKTAIEPFLSDQWFVRMGDVENAKEIEGLRSSTGLAQLAMDAVCEKDHANEEERQRCGKVHFFPERYAKTYLDWLGEKRDWCISRQLWWGHQIPVWSRVTSFDGFPESVLGSINYKAREDLASTLPPDKGRGITSDNHIVRYQIDHSNRSVTTYICLLNENAKFERDLESLSSGFKRDPDVLDTWFSSALWPHSTLGWPDQTAELAKYYPGSVLSTAREIITLWVARMVITGLYNLGKVPFHDVNIHAVIQDAQGRPFKKTLGNGFDPVDIIDFYGADALRFTMASCSTETQDIRMPMKKVKAADGRELQSSDRFELGRNFCNKLWNAARFAFITLTGDAPTEPVAQARVSPVSAANSADTARAKNAGSQPSTLFDLNLTTLPIEDRWILSKTSAAAIEVQAALASFQFSKAVTLARDFFWDSVCDWYLELVKLRVRENRQATEARTVLAFVLDQSLRLLHPFVPFITERLWQQLNQIFRIPDSGFRIDNSQFASSSPVAAGNSQSAALIVALYPPDHGWPDFNNPAVDATFTDLQNATRAVREIRQTQSVPPRQSVDITIKVPAERVGSMRSEAHVIRHLANVGTVTIDPNATAPKNSATLAVGDMQILVHDVIDPAAERERLDKELANLDKQITGLSGELSNEGFVKNAKAELIAAEQQRLADLQAKREQLSQTMAAL